MNILVDVVVVPAEKQKKTVFNSRRFDDLLVNDVPVAVVEVVRGVVAN